MTAIQKLFKQSSHYFVGEMALMVSGFISFPILTRIFSPTEYGLLSLISISTYTLAAISKFGLQHSAVRFFSEFESGKRNGNLTHFYSTIFIGSLLLSFGVLSFALLIKLFLSASLNPNTIDMIWLISAMAFTGSMLVRVKNFLRVEQRTKFFNIISVVERYGRVGVGLIFVLFFLKSVYGYYYGIIFAEALLLAILICILFKDNRIKIDHFSFSFFKECLVYGYPLLSLELADFVIKFTDRYLIQFFLGLESVGIYSVASDLSYYLFSLIFFPVHYAISPIYMEIWNKEGVEQTSKFISKASKYLLMLSIPIIFGFCALGREIIVLFASNKFEKASIIVPYILIGTILWSLYPLYGAGLYIFKKTKSLALLVLFAGIVNVGLNILLIPHFGMTGAAVASLITYVISIGLVMKVSFKYLKIPIDIVSTSKCVAASLIMYIFVNNIRIGEGIFHLLIMIISGIVIYAITMFIIESSVRNPSITYFRKLKIQHFRKLIR